MAAGLTRQASRIVAVALGALVVSAGQALGQSHPTPPGPKFDGGEDS